MATWAAIVTDKGTAREAPLRALVSMLRAAGLRVGGFVRVRGEGGVLEVEDLASSRTAPLAVASETDPDFCGYRFDASAFETVRSWTVAQCFDVVVHDGLGPLEAAKRGHFSMVEAAVAKEDGPLTVLVIRRDALVGIVLALEGEPAAEVDLPASAAALRAFADAIVAARPAIAPPER